VNVAPIVEMLYVSPVATRAAPLAQGSDPSPQAFNESLLAASKASSGTGAVYQAGTGAGRRQKPISQDEKLPSSTPHGRFVSSPAPPQKTQVAQQPPLINPALIQKQLPLGELGHFASTSTVADRQPMGDVPAVTLLPIESKLAQPVVPMSESIPSTHAQKEDDSPQAASLLPPIPHVSQTATNPSNALGNRVLNAISSTLPNALNTVPSVLPDVVQESVPRAVSSAAPSAPLNVALMADSNALESPFPSPAPSVVSTTTQKPLPDAISSAAQNLASPLVPSAIRDASSNAVPAPVLHDGMNPSANGAGAPKSSTVSTGQANPPAVTPDPSGSPTGLSVPGATVDQLVALIQPVGGLPVAAEASALSTAAVAKPSVIAVANGKDGANNAVNDATGLKQHAQAASQTGSQGTAQSGDQSQGDASQQGQSVAPVQVNFANHTIAAVDQAQNAGGAAPLQTAPTLAVLTGHTTKTADIAAAPVTIALPQAVPVINTAKLIQSMSQTEMRVGMRSNDFGNISISTSATRDLISAQISLDHGELAKALAVHLPEMQARLGGNQAVDVRIDMNGQATGQGPGTSPGMSNGSADGSRGDRQQKGSATSSQSGDGFAGQRSSFAAAGLPSGEGRLDARLDIRV
jgi:hypothetical protein